VVDFTIDTQFTPGKLPEKTWILDVRLVDVKTAAIVTTITSNRPSLLPTSTARDAGQRLFEAIREAFPPIGYIIQINGKEATIDLGSEAGLKEGDPLEIVQEGEQIIHPVTGQVLSGPMKVVGELKVASVTPQMSTCKVKKVQGDLKVGSLVRFQGKSSKIIDWINKLPLLNRIIKDKKKDVKDLKENKGMIRRGAAFFLWILCLSGPAGAASFCDPGLPADTKSPLSYQMRGDRCEGLYAQQVSSVSVEVRSLIASFGPFDPATDKELVLSWTEPPGAQGTVRLRVFSFKTGHLLPNGYSRGRRQGLLSLALRCSGLARPAQQDLGLVAWMDLSRPEGATPHGPPAAPRRKQQSERRLRGLSFPFGPSQRGPFDHQPARCSRPSVAVLRKDEELGFGHYPSHVPTVLSTKKLGPAGFYRLAVTAVPKSAFPWSRTSICITPETEGDPL